MTHSLVRNPVVTLTFVTADEVVGIAESGEYVVKPDLYMRPYSVDRPSDF